MSTYAIGDVQGCFDSLLGLLERIAFDPTRDRLWFTGDLVNRGPRSLDVLRWARDQGDRVTTVLGNHDLHFLARAVGLGKKKKLDTLEELLAAPDRDALVGWLRRRPFLHREDGLLLVHAGLVPTWTVAEAEALAREAEQALRGDDFAATLASWDRTWPAWTDHLEGTTRIAAAVGALVHVRMCHLDGSIDREHSGRPEDAPPPLVPWFAFPGRRSRDHEIVFGHWAALGLHLGDGVRAVDTGCVWGEALTAVRLDDGAVFAQPALERRGKDG